MEYGIRELSELAGVSARTLRYYDEIGLLKSLYVSEAGYRFYGKKELEKQRSHMDDLIRTVKLTLLSMRGEYEMSDKEKFEAFKERVVRENEEKYGAEIRKKYGDDEIDASHRKILNMSEADWERFQSLGREIRIRLQEGVQAGLEPESEDARRIVVLHKEWLGNIWKKYTAQAHKAIANMYIADERFKLYYDKEVAGCAELLERAICFWVDKI